MSITLSAVQLTLAVLAVFGVVFSVFLYFKNPQIKNDQDSIRFREELDAMKKQILEIKETHLRSIEGDVKALTAAVAQLDRTVVRLTTIIDERIPKGSPALTPPGV